MRLATSALLIVIFSTLLTPAVLFENQIELTSSENDDLQLNLNNIKTISFEIVNDETKTLNFQDSDQSKPRQEKMVESKSSDLSLETAGLESNIPIFTPLELISPEFGTPPADNITYEEGSTGNTIKWKVNEDNPDRYNVYANGTFLNSNTWSTGFVFTNVDTLSLGIWNITVVFNDTFGNELVGEKYATIIDTTSPNILGPSDTSYLEGTSGNILQWNTTDLNPSNYEITRDGFVVGSGSWVNPSNTSINIDGLNKGVYSYSFTAYVLMRNI